MVNVATAFVRVVRYRVVVQIPANFGHIFVQHIFLAQFAPAFASPESKTVLWPTLRAIPIAAAIPGTPYLSFCLEESPVVVMFLLNVFQDFRITSLKIDGFLDGF